MTANLSSIVLSCFKHFWSIWLQFSLRARVVLRLGRQRVAQTSEQRLCQVHQRPRFHLPLRVDRQPQEKLRVGRHLGRASLVGVVRRRARRKDAGPS